MLVEDLGDEVGLESRACPAQRTLGVVALGHPELSGGAGAAAAIGASIGASRLRMIRRRTIAERALRA